MDEQVTPTADKENLGVDMPQTLVEKLQQEQATTKSADDTYEQSDVFAWANNLYQYKDDLEIDLFLINKNNVMYRAKVASELNKQVQSLFITGILDYVLTKAGEGLVVRTFEEAESEENVLQYTRWKNVEKLTEVMYWIRTQEHEIELFVEEEHDLKRIKAVMARCSHPQMKEPFYVIKQLPTAQILKGDGAWIVEGKVFMPFTAGAGLKIPADNQLLIIDQDLYVFSQPKLDRLFGYNAKKNSIAAKKVAEIQSKFKLAFSAGDDLQTLIKGNKPLINKLQKVELGEIKQEELLDHAEELGVELMCDDSGAIIIEDEKDLRKFINLLNDDYVESNLTGIRYEIKSKKPLKLDEDDEA
jgi:hypothetical protein